MSNTLQDIKKNNKFIIPQTWQLDISYAKQILNLHTFGKQLNCSWPPRQFPSLSTARLIRLMCFTVAFSDMQFRHGSDAIAEGQTFKSQAQLKTLSFVFFFSVVVFSVTFLEFQFSVQIIRLYRRQHLKTNKTKTKNRPLSEFIFHIPTCKSM